MASSTRRAPHSREIRVGEPDHAEVVAEAGRVQDIAHTLGLRVIWPEQLDHLRCLGNPRRVALTPLLAQDGLHSLGVRRIEPGIAVQEVQHRTRKPQGSIPRRDAAGDDATEQVFDVRARQSLTGRVCVR